MKNHGLTKEPIAINNLLTKKEQILLLALCIEYNVPIFRKTYNLKYDKEFKYYFWDGEELQRRIDCEGVRSVGLSKFKEMIIGIEVEEPKEESFENKKDLVVGNWNKVFYENSNEQWGLLFIKERKGNQVLCYGFNGDIWVDKSFGSHNTFELAAPEEIQSALEKEAVKRYKFGDMIDGFLVGISDKNLKNIFKKIHSFDMKDNELWYDGEPCAGVIFKNGIWAEIIKPKQMTQSDIEKELGYKIEILK